jgi:hypothetical protein
VVSVLKLLVKPPRIKVLEAVGAIGDGRIRVVSETEATVKSSTGERDYRVVLVESGEGAFRAYSNDNGTLYRGYIGYPIISFMIVKGILPVDNEVVRAFTGIPWKELNEKYQKYAVVESIVLSRAERMGVPRSIVDEYVTLVFKKLSVIRVYFDEELSRR